MIDLPAKAWLGIAAVITAIATALWLLNIISWWGILIAVPVATVIVGGGLILFGILAWIASGGH